jgi:hypothetical protein
MKVATAFTVGVIRQFPFFREIFSRHRVTISKTLYLLNHPSAKRALLARFHMPQRFFKTFPGAQAVNDSIHCPLCFIPAFAIHSTNPVNVYINTQPRRWPYHDPSQNNGVRLGGLPGSIRADDDIFHGASYSLELIKSIFCHGTHLGRTRKENKKLSIKKSFLRLYFSVFFRDGFRGQ